MNNQFYTDTRRQMTTLLHWSRFLALVAALACLGLGYAAIVQTETIWSGLVGLAFSLTEGLMAVLCLSRARRLRRCRQRLDCIKLAFEAHSPIAVEHHFDQCLAEIDRL